MKKFRLATKWMLILSVIENKELTKKNGMLDR